MVLRVVFLGAAWVLEGEGCMCDYVVLPLLNSSFEPGRAREVVEGFVDVDLRNIARAELFYFMGQAEECCEITRGYLSSRVIELKLSACILYGYSNLTLGNVAAAKRGDGGDPVLYEAGYEEEGSGGGLCVLSSGGVCGGGFASSAYGWDACFWGVQQDAS